MALFQNAISVCDFVGKLFIRALQMIIVPLVVSSIIAGIAGLGGVKGFGRLGMKTLGFYMGTSLAAVIVGLLLVNTIQPGLVDGQPNENIRTALEEQAEGASDAEKKKVEEANKRKPGDYADLFKKMIPANIFSAASSNGQLLGMIFFSILFAIANDAIAPEQYDPSAGKCAGD